LAKARRAWPDASGGSWPVAGSLPDTAEVHRIWPTRAAAGIGALCEAPGTSMERGGFAMVEQVLEAVAW